MSDNFNRDKKDKIINVTKPQQSSSNIDASRVSAYTLKEQQSLERLKKKMGANNAKESKASAIKTIVAIILVLVLILIAVLFVLLISKNGSVPEEDYEMRLSMQIENKSALSIITEAGQEQLRKINPGDEVALRASVRNSTDIHGDLAEDTTNPPSIYVRFKLVLILDYKERYDILKPTMSDSWYVYNKDTELALGSQREDDHYFYYLGSLSFMEPAELFSSILFDGDKIFFEDGGKYGQIQVEVEAIEANISAILSRSIWQDAPQGWIQEMMDMWYGRTDAE